MITGTLSNHYKYQKNLGQVNFRWQLPSGSLTFANSQTLAGVACSTIVSGSNFATAGAVIGDRVYTNSSNAGNKGPFIIIGISTVTLYVVLTTGVAPTFAAGTEATDTIGTSLLKCMLTRSLFSFNKATYGKLINFQSFLAGTTNPVYVTLTTTVGMAAGGFLAAGFVVGNSITFAGFTNGGNNATFKIATLSDTLMTVTHLDGSAPSMTNEGPSTSITFTTSDELANGNGYTTGGVVSGVPVLSEDDVNGYANISIPTISWTASGGSIGPSASLIIFDLATTDNVCCGNLDFSGDSTAVTGSAFVVAGVTLRDV
jgi:hypothetical protein